MPVAATLNALGETGSVISGSTALSLIVPNTFSPQDMDIYVPKGGLPAMHQFLSRETDYVLVYESLASSPSDTYSANQHTGKPLPLDCSAGLVIAN
jgi:hypothetical protein